MQVMDLDSLVAAISGQVAQTQATCASMLVANGFFFAAMKAVFVFPDILKAVLDDIQLQVHHWPITGKLGHCRMATYHMRRPMDEKS